MVAGRPPKGEQNQEAIELIEGLKEQLKLKTDGQLAKWLGAHSTHITRWKANGIPEIDKNLIKYILGKK